MNIKDVIDQAEKEMREEWNEHIQSKVTKSDGYPFHKNSYYSNQIADFWLSKYSSYTKDLLQSLVEEIGLVEGEKFGRESYDDGFEAGMYFEKQKISFSLINIIKEIK